LAQLYRRLAPGRAASGNDYTATVPPLAWRATLRRGRARSTAGCHCSLMQQC